MTTENLHTPRSIRTRSGIYVNVFEPTPKMFVIEDIAHALSHQTRWSGHLPHFYSVAQHSVMTALIVPEEHLLAALMHDASEAYLVDLPSPIKAEMVYYKEVENGVMHTIANKFGFQWPLHEEVKKADAATLQFEWDECMIGSAPRDAYWDPDKAKKIFLELYHECIKAK